MVVSLHTPANGLMISVSGTVSASKPPSGKDWPGLRLNEHMEEEDGSLVFRHACRLGLGGIVSKQKDSRYRSGRSPHWIKSKNPLSAAVRREAEEDWQRWPKRLRGLRNGARALLAQAVHGNFCSTGTPTRSAMMAADAWCATAISRARNHDRHRPGGGSLPAGTRSHVGQGCGRIRFSSASGVEIPQRSNLPPYPQPGKA
jgi:hypothetical protein